VTDNIKTKNTATDSASVGCIVATRKSLVDILQATADAYHFTSEGQKAECL